MGERTRFHPGDKVPNDGTYMEVGMDDFHMGIENPRRVKLNKGDTFPSTKNHERKWTLTRKNDFPR